MRVHAGISQAQLARSARVSRHWVSALELGRLRALDLRKVAVIFALLGYRLTINAYPTGEPIRDAGQARLLERFNARISPTWRRSVESVMPAPGDLRAWDELLRGAVSIGVEVETHPRDLQATERSMAAKLRDSGADRMILVVGSSRSNRELVRNNVGLLRQTFPLDTRATLAALADGRDPGANGLVII